MTVHWHWEEISGSVWHIKRGKDRIGLAVLQSDGLWRASATHEGVSGIATHRAPVNAIVQSLRDMVAMRAAKRGTTRAEELAKIDKRAIELMSSEPPPRKKRRKRRPR